MPRSYIPTVRDRVQVVRQGKPLEGKRGTVKSVYEQNREARVLLDDLFGVEVPVILKWRDIKKIDDS